ncbi:hypothetical protein BDV96DRAFT_337937 [Lophiotrema nucula]|uniref:Uncharacterized protein n=1 Tax=Lophiotrema nucula TaxID=690887 RepID=A0A6A5YIQ5_9PLEO|nr:hypothetical protein BDV96DRAFT_337937 [Lophiotrema nucula]
MADNTPATYWENYLKWIATLVGESSGDRKIFVCPSSSLSPLASTVVPEALTNHMLLPIADTLLSPDTAIFDASHTVSYFRTVDQYLSDVVVGGDKSQGAQDAFDIATAAYTAASTKLRDVTNRADDAYLADKDPDKKDFASWAVEKYAELDIVQEEASTAFEAWKNAAIKKDGTRGAAWTEACQNIEIVKKSKREPAAG